MRCLRIVDVNDNIVDELWKKVENLGSFYSISDGVTKSTFRKMLFESTVLLQAENLVIRISESRGFIELHPIVFGPMAFRQARYALSDVGEYRDKLFAGKPLCCIIPNGMRGAKKLAMAAGMTETGDTNRLFSGILIPCSIFIWR